MLIRIGRLWLSMLARNNDFPRKGSWVHLSLSFGWAQTLEEWQQAQRLRPSSVGGRVSFQRERGDGDGRGTSRDEIEAQHTSYAQRNLFNDVRDTWPQ